MQIQTPTDRLYRNGVPLDGSKLTDSINPADAEPSIQQSIDWDQPTATDEDTAYATASAASHYHYQNVSHVLLCDTILQNGKNVSEPLRTATELFAQQCAKDVTAWGTYLKQHGAGGHIPQEQREYYHMLFQETEVLPVLLGIQTKNIAADKSRQDFYKHGDPLFYKVADGTTEEHQHHTGPLTRSFRDAINPLPIEERERLLKKVAQQVDLMQLFCMKRHGDIYKPLNSDANTFLQQTGKKLKQFYNDIGLTNDIF